VTAQTATAPELAAVIAAVSSALESRLPEHAERLDWDAERLAAHQRDRLRDLLATAIERSPFHASRLRDIDPETFEPGDLPRLPVMRKDEMMARFDDVVTDRRLEQRVVEEHLAVSTEAPGLLFDDYVCLASGGSSGLRGLFVQRIGEYAEFGCSIMRRAWARLTAMGGPLRDVPVGMVAAVAPIHSTGFAAAVVREGPFRFSCAPATDPLQGIAETLEQVSPVLLMGYPGKLAELADRRRAGRLDIAPLAVSSTSEPLTPELRGAIETGFGVPVVDQFACTEGLVGGSDPGGSVLSFASDMCIAEPVDADGRPVGVGETAAKVLVTNFHNLTQPLIRYELTDRFTVESEPEAGWLRARVEGRADEVLSWGGVSVHPHAIRSPLVTAAVREHQVRQTADGVDIAVVADEDLDTAGLAAAIEAVLGSAGLARPRAAVRVVDGVPRDPVTGKTRRFVPLARA
jgi:phenylacetate-coenzyme A ligase PaaK-like adenylate-forming protein